MTEGVLISVEFDQFNFVPEMSKDVETALVRALNKTADRSRTRAARMARDQVNFPASYVSPSGKRLWVSQRATKRGFQSVISGRGNATSLARFTKQGVLPPGARHKGGKINLTVKPGRKSSIKRAFLIRLKNDNVGLAVRTNGNKPRGAYKPKEIGKNLWLLYGPSVDQTLIAASDSEGIYEELSPETLAFLEAEFNRQMNLLENKSNG